MEKLTNVGCVKNIELADKSKKVQWSVQSLTLSIDLDAFERKQVNAWAKGSCWIYVQGLLRSRFETAEQVLEFLKKHSYIISPEMIQELLDMASRAPKKDPGAALVDKRSKMPEGEEKEKVRAEYIALISKA